MDKSDPGFLKPVDTRGKCYTCACVRWLINMQEQLVWRYRQVIKRLFSKREHEYLRASFEKFSSNKTHWTQEDFDGFLTTCFPEMVAQSSRASSPLLYRWFIKLGSYPYHQDPETSLTLEVLQVAICSMIGRDSISHRSNNTDEADDLYYERMRQRYIRLTFQCLAVDGSPQSSPRNSTEDEDLADAIRLINRKRTIRYSELLPAAAFILPKPHPASFYPSSWSMSLSGAIPSEEFASLLRLLLSCQLYISGIGPEIVMSDEPAFSKTVKIMLKAFNIDSDDHMYGSILWDDFRPVIDISMPQLFGVMNRLISPLINSTGVLLEDLQTLNQREPVNSLRTRISATTELQKVPDSTGTEILKFTLLAQLSTLLSLEMPFLHRPPLRIASSSITSAVLLRSCLLSQSQDRILLIHGTYNQKNTAIPTLRDSRFVCGVFLLAESARYGMTSVPGPSVLFQLTPNHCIYHGTQGISIQFQESVTSHSSDIVLKVQDAQITLSLCSTFTDSCGVWNDIHMGETISFRIENISWLDFDDNGFVHDRFRVSVFVSGE